MNKTSVKNLYDQDFYLWVEDTVSKLKARDNEHLDWDNLIEEVESLGKSQRKTVRSFLVRLLEHLLTVKATEKRKITRKEAGNSPILKL